MTNERGRRRTPGLRQLIPLAAAAVVLGAVACGGRTPAAEPTATPHSLHPSASELLAAADQGFATRSPMIVNVYLHDDGFSPEIVSVPVGRPLQLVMRNRGTQAHGYQIDGLVLVDNVFFVRDAGIIDAEGEQRSTGAAATGETTPAEYDEHAAHHAIGHMAPRSACAEGVKDCGRESTVVARIEPGEVAVVMFAVSIPGRFSVKNPLSPAEEGRLVVF